MRFTIDGWDPSYGQATEWDAAPVLSDAQTDTAVEFADADWAPVPVGPTAVPSTILFVDGVRRIDARLWVEGPDDDPPVASVCASYAAGVIRCANGRAQLDSMESRRGLFTTAAHATAVETSAGRYDICHTTVGRDTPLLQALSLALQRRMGELEVLSALAARSTTDAAAGDDLIVTDGPLRGRTHLPRALGLIKTHRTDYLLPHLNAVVGRLTPGQRTPVFLLGSSWDRHTWYLRLPARSTAPWAGVVRVECSADLTTDAVIALANISQSVLPTYASAEHKDPRAPQNLYPIGGLETALRRRLGDPRLLYRALAVAAGRTQSALSVSAG